MFWTDFWEKCQNCNVWLLVNLALFFFIWCWNQISQQLQWAKMKCYFDISILVMGRQFLCEDIPILDRVLNAVFWQSFICVFVAAHVSFTYQWFTLEYRNFVLRKQNSRKKSCNIKLHTYCKLIFKVFCKLDLFQLIFSVSTVLWKNAEFSVTQFFCQTNLG